MLTISFPFTDRFWNSLRADYFPLTRDLNGFKSTVNGYHIRGNFFCLLFL